MNSSIRRGAAVLVMTMLVGASTAPSLEAKRFVGADQVTLSLTDAQLEGQSGDGLWGCFLCLVGAGAVISGGPAAVLAFLSSPAAVPLLALCAMQCADTFDDGEGDWGDDGDGGNCDTGPCEPGGG